MWEVEEESHESSGSERGKEEKEWESEDGGSEGVRERWRIIAMVRLKRR